MSLFFFLLLFFIQTQLSVATHVLAILTSLGVKVYILEHQFTAPSIKNVQILSAKFCHVQDGPLYICHNLKGSEA